MCAKIKDGVNIVPILERLEELATVDTDRGIVSYPLFSDLVPRSVLESQIEFDPSLHSSAFEPLIKEAYTKELLDSGEICVNPFINRLKKLERGHLGLKIKRYALVSNISVDKSCLPYRIDVNGHTVRFSKTLPKKFERNDVAHLVNQFLPEKLPKDYSFVRVEVDAREPIEAAEKGLDTLDFYRGIWNLIINKGDLDLNLFIRNMGPFNRVLIGPYHTIHEVSGPLALKQIWYDPTFFRPSNVFNYRNKSHFHKQEAFLRRKISSSINCQVLRKAVIQYTNAMDEREPSNAYGKLWAILERLTDTNNKIPYDKMIKRAAFTLGNRRYSVEVLKHLKTSRNNLVHENSQLNRGVIDVVSLSSIVLSLLFLFLEEHSLDKTIHEMAGILDLPYEKEERRKLIEKIEYSLEVFDRK